MWFVYLKLGRLCSVDTLKTNPKVLTNSYNQSTRISQPHVVYARKSLMTFLQLPCICISKALGKRDSNIEAAWAAVLLCVRNWLQLQQCS